jgi:hypothetical protein
MSASTDSEAKHQNRLKAKPLLDTMTRSARRPTNVRNRRSNCRYRSEATLDRNCPLTDLAWGTGTGRMKMESRNSQAVSQSDVFAGRGHSRVGQLCPLQFLQ